MPGPIQFDLNVTNVNLSEPQAPTGGVYGTLFQPLFGTLSAADQQAIWVEFLTANNLPDPPPTDAATQSLFTSYATSAYTYIENLITSKQTTAPITLPLLNPPTTGFYGTAFKAYFSNLTPLQQQQIWVQFLQNNNFTITAPPEDPAIEEKFINYSATVLGIMQSGEIQSPQEVKQRAILTSTFDTLTFMLNTLQDTVGTQSQNLIYYGNLQQDYSTAMTRVPTYIGNPVDTVSVPATVDQNTDWTKFALGYNNVSVADIASWWAYNSLTPNGSSQTFTISSVGTTTPVSGPPAVPLFTITFTPQSGTTPGSITWTMNQPLLSPVTNSITIPVQNSLNTFSASGSTGVLQNAITSYSSAFEASFASAWNQAGSGIAAALNTINGANLTSINNITPASATPTNVVTPRGSNDTSSYSGMELPWLYGYVAPSAQQSDAQGNTTPAGNLSNQQAKSRSEINAQLQNFIENLRSRRQTVQNLAQTNQTNLDQSRQAVTDQSDILDSTLQTITDIVRAISRMR